MIVRFFIGSNAFICVGEVSYSDALSLGHSLTLSTYDNPLQKYGEVTIVTESGVNLRGLVGAVTQEIGAGGRTKTIFSVTDFSPRLSYLPFTGRFVGNLIDMVNLMVTRSGCGLAVRFRISAEAEAAEINQAIVRQKLGDCLQQVLDSSGFALAFRVLVTGELEIFEFGYGEIAPFISITEGDDGTLRTGIGGVVYTNGSYQITDMPPQYSAVEVYGKNPDKAVRDNATIPTDFPVSFPATQGTNIYGDLPANADLISATLTTRIISTDTLPILNLISETDPLLFSNTGNTGSIPNQIQQLSATSDDDSLTGLYLLLLSQGSLLNAETIIYDSTNTLSLAFGSPLTNVPLRVNGDPVDLEIGIVGSIGIGDITRTFNLKIDALVISSGGKSIAATTSFMIIVHTVITEEGGGGGN